MEMPDHRGQRKAKLNLIGKSEHGSVIQKLPFQRKLSAKELDTSNLRALLTTPVHCMITLAELLNLRPNMWNDLRETGNKGS